MDDPNAKRFTVKVSNIDPSVPQQCVRCSKESPDKTRRLSFRRSDGTVERVSSVAWPYCGSCEQELKPLDARQKWLTIWGFVQTAWVVYAIGWTFEYYSFWWPSVFIFLGAVFAFIYAGKRTKGLWGLEWARIDDVYKGGRGAEFSFRNRDYAEAFAKANTQ